MKKGMKVMSKEGNEELKNSLRSSSVLTHVTYFLEADKPSQTWAFNPG